METLVLSQSAEHKHREKNTGNRSTERKESRGKVVAGRQKESNLLRTRTRARDVVQWYKTCLACLTACKALCLIPSTTKRQNPETEDRTRESRGGCNCMSQQSWPSLSHILPHSDSQREPEREQLGLRGLMQYSCISPPSGQKAKTHLLFLGQPSSHKKDHVNYTLWHLKHATQKGNSEKDC